MHKKPTYAQIGRIYNWFSWRIPLRVAKESTEWLENNATREEVSAEMDRIKRLYDTHRLDIKTCFESDIWKNYKGERK